MNFPFPPLKLPNKRREEYSKNIPFFPFHSLLPNKPLRKVLGSSLESFFQVHRFTHQKKDKSPSYLFFDSFKTTTTIKNTLPCILTGPTPKRKKTLSSSLPLILLGPATSKGTSFHARVIYFYFLSRTINLVRILVALTLESMISSRNF